MRKHYIGTGLLGFFGIIIIIIGISLVGSPTSQQELRFDEIRLSDFSSIKYKVEDYYRNNKKLPDSLSKLDSLQNITDPETKKDYEYKNISPAKFGLCAEFSTDSKEVSKKKQRTSIYDSLSSTVTHKKGYDCVEYALPQYMINEALINSPLSTEKEATASASLASITKTGDCKWLIYVSLKGFKPNSPITVTGEGQNHKCDEDSPKPYFYIEERGQTSAFGSAVISYIHEDYGNFNYTFADNANTKAKFNLKYDLTTLPKP